MPPADILVTAATPWEARPLRDHWRLEAETPSLHRGTVGGRMLRLVRTGIGARKTAEALSTLDAAPGTLVISAGLAGALQPGIRSGDLTADLREAPVELVEAARDAAKSLGVPLHLGAFHTSDSVLASPEAKRSAGERLRAAAVDMESAAVRKWCRSRGGTFVGARAILDALDDRLPEDFSDDASAAGLARFALSHWAELPWLLRLGVRQRRAMRNLVRFMDRWISSLKPLEAASLP